MPKSRYIKATPHGKSGVLYETEDGEKYLRTGGTWTWRNNNPGNVVPLKTYDYFTSKNGDDKNAVQVIVKEGRVDFGLIKDIPKNDFPEKKGEIGIDLGIIELVNTSTGNRYGTTLFPLLKKYDKIIIALKQGRMRQNLMTNSQRLDNL